uniref:Protein deacetylase HDAC6 n=1 Tax=Cacopsylla melanoneura TaxID=428564 RepID=A0A8D8ZMH7_9HEMI
MKNKDLEALTAKTMTSTSTVKTTVVPSGPKTRRSPRITTQQATSSSTLADARRRGLARKKPKRSQDYIRDMYFNAQQSKDLIMKPTGITYDDSMDQHVCLWDSNYPECPERYTRVIQRCKELGLVDRCQFIQPREATRDEILKKHTEEQIEILANTENSNNVNELEQLSSHYDAIYIHPTSYRLSLLSAGSTIELVDNICKGNVQNGMAIIRPPGHHAMKSEYCGYCFFNNVALAAQHALDNTAVNRILIVDWDVHHGQATQQMFYNDNRVVYFSLHRYEHGTFWPNLRESDYDFIGEGPGRGYNFNIPLNKTHMSDADYLAVFQQVLLPMLAELNPQLIMISAGYDAALGDEKGDMDITPACYAHLLNSLSGFAQGKVAVILEGGYCLKSLAEGAALTLRALLDDPCPNLEPLGAPSDSITETILNCIYEHRPYWNCYKFQDVACDGIQSPLRLHKPKAEFKFDGDPKQEVYATRDCYPIQDEAFVKLCDERLDKLRASTTLLSPPHKVCLVYNELMLKHKNITDPVHPEQPARISSIFEKHKEFGLIDRVHLLQSRIATAEELGLVHTESHIQSVLDLDELTPRQLMEKGKGYESVYLHPSTRDSAYLAAGCLLEVVDSVLNGESAHGVAIIRPPGHHAEQDEPCGFCIFNNVSVAAKYALESHGLSRVLILDWDVHHGNGTQRMFYNDPRVLYISVHRYDHGTFFPHSKDAGPHSVGEGKGEGYNVNIAWNKKGMSDPEYIAAFQQVILPIAYQFDPQLVLVSAGYDACVNDPLGGCKVSPEAYAHFTHWLKSLAQGRIILALEGGYNISSISYAMTLCTKALLGDPLPLLESDLDINSSAVSAIKETISCHTRYWSCLKFLVALPETNLLHGDYSPLDLVMTKLNLNEPDITDSTPDKVQDVTPNQSSPQDADDTTTSSSSKPIGSRQDELPGPSSSSSQSSEDKKQTLTDYLSEHAKALVNEEMFMVTPLPDCPHTPLIAPVPETGIDVNAPCTDCHSQPENWVCLTCYQVRCGRYIEEHAMLHGVSTEHPLALSFADLSVWCYVCEAYVDNHKLYEAKNAAHRSKFGEALVWSYGPRLC